MTLKQICCWLWGHKWTLEWEEYRVLGWPLQRIKVMRCLDCGLERKP